MMAAAAAGADIVDVAIDSKARICAHQSVVANSCDKACLG